MSLTISLLLIGLLVSLVLSRRSDIDPLLVICGTPLWLISGVFALSGISSTLGFLSLSVRELSNAILILTLVASTTYLIRTSHHLIQLRSRLLGFELATGLTSIAIWRIGHGVINLPPSDNDALVHAFTLRRIGEMGGHLACLLPKDSITEYGLRFVPCGSQILHYFDFVGHFDTKVNSLNSLYLVAALTLPLGAAALLREVRPDNRVLHLSGALASMSFLVVPYGLNGTLPYLVGLSFLLPVLTIVHRTLMQIRKNLLILLASLLGLVLIHPTVGVLALVVLTGCLLARNSIRQTLAIFVAGVVLAPVVVPETVRDNLFSGLATANSSDYESGSGLTQRLILGSSWARPQPLLLILCLIGFVHVGRSGTRFLRVLATLWVVLFLLWLTVDSNSAVLRGLRVPFYGNWYRILGGLEIVSVIGAAIGVGIVINLSRVQARSLTIALLCSLSVVSLITGTRIVAQAWSRPSTAMRQILDDVERIPDSLRGNALNDPTDGSAWAYVGTHLTLVAPVDRAPDTNYAEVIDNLGSSVLRPLVCAVIDEARVRLLVLTSKRFGLGFNLQAVGVLDPPVFTADYVAVFPFSSEFIADCNRRRSICVDKKMSVTWFETLMRERSVRPISSVYCRY